jgi:hypothetical protein
MKQHVSMMFLLENGAYKMFRGKIASSSGRGPTRCGFPVKVLHRKTFHSNK